MFELDEKMTYWVYSESVDFRCGIPRLYDLICAHISQTSFLTGNNVFLFFSRSRHDVKILRYDDGGILMYQKKLEMGSFELPKHNGDGKSFSIDYQTLKFIMKGISLKSIKRRRWFRLDQPS